MPYPVVKALTISATLAFVAKAVNAAAAVDSPMAALERLASAPLTS